MLLLLDAWISFRINKVSMYPSIYLLFRICHNATSCSTVSNISPQRHNCFQTAWQLIKTRSQMESDWLLYILGLRLLPRLEKAGQNRKFLRARFKIDLKELPSQKSSTKLISKYKRKRLSTKKACLLVHISEQGLHRTSENQSRMSPVILRTYCVKCIVFWINNVNKRGKYNQSFTMQHVCATISVNNSILSHTNAHARTHTHTYKAGAPCWWNGGAYGHMFTVCSTRWL